MHGPAAGGLPRDQPGDVVCHGPGVNGGGVIPDLRFMGIAKHNIFNDIVLGGVLKDAGMVSFADVINQDDASNIQAYIIAEGKRLRSIRAENSH